MTTKTDILGLEAVSRKNFKVKTLSGSQINVTLSMNTVDYLWNAFANCKNQKMAAELRNAHLIISCLLYGEVKEVK